MGFQSAIVENHSDVFSQMVRQVQAAGSGDFTWPEKGRSPGVDFADAKQFAQATLSAIHGKLGYAIFIATRPWI